LVFLGSGEFARPTLQWLATSSHVVSLVVTQPARESGRGRRVTPTPVRLLADELGLACLEAENVNDPAVVSRLASLEARIGLVIAFGQKLGAGVTGAFPCGCVNLHASLLPRYRGAAPIHWALLQGERETGVTVFRIVERMDAGPILVQRSLAIGADETAGALHDRLAEMGVEAVGEALATLENDNPPGRPQNNAEATVARKLSKADGFVRFDRLGEEIARHIRAMTPWPGATARFESGDGRWENVTLLRVRPLDEPIAADFPIGSLDDKLRIRVKRGLLELVELKPSSGRGMSWSDYVNGRRVTPGDHFTSPA